MSGKAVHRVYSTQSQEAFLEGHLAAFDEFGGTPTGHIRYDNLKSAVTRVLFGDRGRIENQRWVLSDPIRASRRSTASPGSPEPMRKAVSRARADAFAATTWS
ncbi:hypothetical protein JF781_26475 [Mycobacterium sp. WUMAC-067]|nr:hypothetical protein [Mycobacterium sp. WUMAC-067]MCA2317681.1 hypothetical protein [Mycobacterium sp. WUMAC-025]